MKQPLINYRFMTLRDYPAVYQLWSETPGVDLTRADEFVDIERFLKRNPESSAVAFDGERLIGAVLCGHDGRRGFLHHLAVDPEYRRMGIGRNLVDICLASLQSQGIEKCHLFIRKDNVSGLEFWKASGWAERITLTMASRTLDPDSPDDPDSC